jgi:hypothetical protein
MSTHDYQSNTGSSKLLFKYPKEDSQDYWTTDNKVIVPHGLFYNNDNGGSDKGVTTTVESEDSYRTLWGFSLGAEIGIPKIASFSVNSKFENEVEESSKISLTRSIARTIETRYAMVVDKARLDLSDEFRERIEELRRQHVLGYEPNFSAFMSAFGTHYPYAVTYGGLAYLELFGSSQSSSLSQRDKLELEIKANALIDVLSVGVSGGGNYEQAQKNQRAIKEEKFKFGTMGGSISRGQGWTLPRGEEVPIFLDLRPLYELFSPLYFDDPVIWGDLRVGLSVTFNNYINMVEEEAAFDALEQLHGDTRQQNWSDALEKFLILYPKSQHLVIIRDNYIQKDPILQAKFLQKIEALIKQLDKK